MQIFIFIVGLIVTVMVIGGLYALVPREISPPKKIFYRKGSAVIES